MKISEIKDIPLRQLAKLRRFEFEDSGENGLYSAFDWEKTLEGKDFWGDVCSGLVTNIPTGLNIALKKYLYEEEYEFVFGPLKIKDVQMLDEFEHPRKGLGVVVGKTKRTISIYFRRLTTKVTYNKSDSEFSIEHF